MFAFIKRNDTDLGVLEFRSSKGAFLLDVRTPEEYAEGHIPGSINIDSGLISEAEDVIIDKDAPLYVYCRSGGRSSSATAALKRMGYSNVKNIGGIIHYTGPIQKGSKA